MPADDNIKGREQCPPAPEGLEIDAIQPINTVQNRARRTEHLETLAVAPNLDRWLVAPHPSGDVVAYGASDTVRLLDRRTNKDIVLLG